MGPHLDQSQNLAAVELGAPRACRPPSAAWRTVLRRFQWHVDSAVCRGTLVQLCSVERWHCCVRWHAGSHPPLPRIISMTPSLLAEVSASLRPPGTEAPSRRSPIPAHAMKSLYGISLTAGIRGSSHRNLEWWANMASMMHVLYRGRWKEHDVCASENGLLHCL